MEFAKEIIFIFRLVIANFTLFYYHCSMNEHIDQRYILALREGKYGLLEEIYKKYTPQVSKWVQRNNGSADDAQDVFQETILALHQKAADPDFILTCPLGALIFKISKNKWLNQLRKKSKDAEVRIIEGERYKDGGSILPTLEEVEETEIRHRKLDETFKQLSDICQKLLRLLTEGMASTEVATIMGMSNANTVYRRKNACVMRWRTLYEALN